ncbi:type I restriction enzyme HsdR N-terminal domain-containing protein [Clostridium sp. CS001]|uniref:type I restriction endonuclease n=1 Tax=Clostridium sp. CS001 TaxID=2880648 RepID=UPI001CF334A1|nr:type I restriction endonuclease [Clostridium sp. CS001]MCB2291668.1 type I restriction enzyme HsdR N-terminal domain-containing protein [Clostridium sp. CS001]
MDFMEEIKLFSNRIMQIKDKIQTEEAVKTSIILPFFNLLGYDIFNPEEFIPEYTTDVGIKKGEKIDYVIMRESSPVLLIEVKNCPDKNLKRNVSQLFRYFAVSKARYGLLTNGFSFIFYTDLNEKNIMDTESFFEFNILDLNDKDIIEISKYTKNNFNVDEMYESASELRYLNKIKQLIISQSKKPSDAFVNYILGEMNIGRRTKTLVDTFRTYTKASLKILLTDNKQSIINGNNFDVENIENPITMTQLELESFYIVKSILRKIIEPENITFIDSATYFTVIIANNSEKWVCKVHMKNKRQISLPYNNEVGEIFYDFESIDDFYELDNELMDIAKKLIH